jgi:hypothetical protein
MQMAENLDALKWWWLGVFIAPTTKPTLGVGLLSMGAPDSPVRQPRHPTVMVLTVSTIGALTSWCTGQSGAALDRHCSLFGAPLAPALISAANCSSVRVLCSRTLR